MPALARDDPSYKLRHSTAHVLVQAVREMFPGARLAWGPPHDRFENGFYYDFDLPRALTPEDLPELEGRMRRIIEETTLSSSAPSAWRRRAGSSRTSPTSWRRSTSCKGQRRVRRGADGRHRYLHVHAGHVRGPL